MSKSSFWNFLGFGSDINSSKKENNLAKKSANLGRQPSNNIGNKPSNVGNKPSNNIGNKPSNKDVLGINTPQNLVRNKSRNNLFGSKKYDNKAPPTPNKLAEYTYSKPPPTSSNYLMKKPTPAKNANNAKKYTIYDPSKPTFSKNQNTLNKLV